MNITHDKTLHFVVITKPKEAQLQSLAEPAQPTHKSQQLEVTWADQPNFNNNGTAGAPSHQVLTCPIRLEEDTCPLRVESFLYKLKSHHFLCDTKLRGMWQKAGKLQPAVPSFFSNPIGQKSRVAMIRSLKLLKQHEINSFSY